MHHWQQQVDTAQPLTIGVNLSSKAFMRDDIVEQIQQILQETGFAATSLKIEITEHVMMDHVETTITKLARLRDLGVQLCIDDFGTGYSSLRYLHRFPIQTLKIDRSFVSTLNVNDESAAITQSIVMLSHTLRKETIAEGIETAAQLHYLQELHCEYGQGYFFSRPVDPPTAETMLTTTFPVNATTPDHPGSDEQGGHGAPTLKQQPESTTPCQTIIALLQQRVTELEQRLDTCQRMCAELHQERDPLWALADTERLDVSHTLTRSGQAEAVLRVWERALATVTSGILITDVNRPDMPIIYCNAAFERMTGYTPAETLGHNCRFLQGPDTDPVDVAAIRDAVAAGQGCQIVLLNYRKDGTPFWNELAITPLYDPAGRLTHYIGVITDVTERKRMEDALQASEETFRGFFEQSQDALLLVDAQGSVTAWNEGAEQIFGLSRTETLGRPKWDVLFRLTPEEYRTPAMHERIKAAVLNMIANTGQGNPLHQQPIERETQLPDGTRRTVSTRIFPIQTNTGLLIGGITRDITKLKRTQAAIRESQDRLQAILDNAAVGIVLLDREGHFIEVNGRWIEMLGMTRYEVYQKRWLDLVNPEDSATSREAMQPLLRGEVEGFRLEQRFRRKDGSLFWGDLSTRALLNERGELESVIGIIADITERKQAEQALQLAHAQSQVWVGKLRQRNRDMTLLNELSDVLQTCQTVNDAYQAIIPVLSQLFPNRAGALYIVDATRTYLELAVAWGAPQRWPPGFAGAICRSLTQGPLHTSGPGATDICCRMADSAIPSLCVPLVAHGEHLGVLRLSEMELPSLTARQRAERLTVTVADYLALAIANLQLREHLQNQAIRDALTGLFNRRYLDETLQRELQHAARHQHPVGVIMLDVDHFKQFNDRFGHKGGDALLQALGAFLQQHIRSEDIACRYGGEEFMLILPEATLEDTQIRAEQLRAGVEHLRIIHEQQQLDSVTISLGIAGFPTHGSTTATLIGAADAALYHAKTSGRNRVICATLPLVEAPDTTPLCT
jgi:diguanylate cyclase (GGDEF)-like protein/PAS domain S-box-containing protein